MKHQLFEITFANKATAKGIKIPQGSSLVGIAESLALPPSEGVIVIIGGAAIFDTPEFDTVRGQTQHLMEPIARLAQEKKLTVISGGTSSGVMQQIGQAWVKVGGGFSLIGVSPLGNVRYPGHNPDGETFALDSNYNAFILIESSTWGDETAVIAEFSHLLAQGKPIIEVIVNGGEITRSDAAMYLKRGGDLITVQGSGRFADELATAVGQKKSDDPALQTLIDSGRVHVFPLADGADAFGAMLLKISGW